MQLEEQEIGTTEHDTGQLPDQQINTLQKQLREESKEIIDISYLVDDNDAINEALKNWNMSAKTCARTPVHRAVSVYDFLLRKRN